MRSVANPHGATPSSSWSWHRAFLSKQGDGLRSRRRQHRTSSGCARASSPAQRFSCPDTRANPRRLFLPSRRILSAAAHPEAEIDHQQREKRNAGNELHLVRRAHFDDAEMQRELTERMRANREHEQVADDVEILFRVIKLGSMDRTRAAAIRASTKRARAE